MKTLLVVWQEIPENCKLYLLKHLSDNKFDTLLKAHGKYLNLDEDVKEVDMIGDMIENAPDIFSNVELLEDKAITNLPEVDGVIITGLVM